MDLDNIEIIKKLDTQNMLGEIDNLPSQLQSAWKLGQTQTLPENKAISQIIICGMGGSAIGADLLAGYAASTCPIPITVHRDYGLPACAKGSETLVIASSHSGNTEETLDSFAAAIEKKCTLMAVTTGGKLSELANQAHIPLVIFSHAGQPRAAVGHSFGILLALLSKMGLLGDPGGVEKTLMSAINNMKEQQEQLRVNVPVVKNPAKRMAGQVVGRWVNVFGAGLLAPVARRWKTQVNEIAKAGAGFEALPEADHNTLAGLVNPEEVLSRTFSIFLHSSFDHPRNTLRLDLTRQEFMLQGMNADTYTAQGASSLAQIWTTLHFGDYVSFFLAVAYGVDPTPVEVLENFKRALKKAG
jgi:glucose/mannose-6-phosphate isomerase